MEKNWALSEFGVGHCGELIHPGPCFWQPPLCTLCGWGPVPPEGLGQQPAQGPATPFPQAPLSFPCSRKEPLGGAACSCPSAWSEAGLTRPPVCLCFQFEEDVEIGEEAGTSRRNSRLLVGSFSKRKVCPAPRQGACPYVPQPEVGRGLLQP